MRPNNKRQWLLRHVDEQQDPLLRYVSSIVKNREAAEDLVQEAFLRLWKEDPERLGTNVKPWLFHVCRNLAFDRLRKNKKQSTEDIETLVDSEQMSADQQMEEEENKSWLTGAISNLSVQQREVLQLKFQADLSYKEIAAITKLSVSHVGVILHQSLQILNAAREKSQWSGEPALRKKI